MDGVDFMVTRESRYDLAYENRFASLDVKLTELKGDMNLLKWMMGILIAGVASLVIKAFVA